MGIKAKWTCDDALSSGNVTKVKLEDDGCTMCTPSKTESKGKPKSRGRGKPTDKAEMYRQQLGGTQAALNRERQRVKELEEENNALRALIAGHYNTRRDGR